MKHFSVLIIVACSFISVLQAQTILHTESFETDGEGTRYTSNTFVDCTNSDFFFRTNTNPVTPPACAALFGTALTNLQGSFFWASEDIRSSTPTPGSRPPGSITTQAINVSNFNNLTVSLYLATSNNNNVRWESADSLNIQASFNGVNYFTVGRFMGKGTPVVGARLGIDGNLNGSYDVGVDPATDCDVANFTRYTFSIPGTGTNLYIRLDFDQQGGTEELAIDHIQVSGVSTLPVKLVSFTAVKNNSGEVKLNWQITDAADASSFDVERSSDGNHFIPIGAVPADSRVQYMYSDLPAAGMVYYRLRMADRDGRYTYSQVLKMTDAVAVDLLQVFPNPAMANLQVSQTANRLTAGQYIIYDATGRQVKQWPVLLRQGNNSHSVDISSIPPGNYTLIWQEDGRRKLSRLFIKQ